MINSNVGIDGVHCTIVLHKQTLGQMYIDKNLKNSDGTTYGNVKSFGENIKLRFNIPLMLRDDNLQPYGKYDNESSSYIKTKLLIDLNNIFGDKIKKIVPNAIEVNITKKINKNVDINNMIKLLKLSYLHKTKQTATWEILNEHDRSKIKTVGMLSCIIKNEYRLKCYNKTEQMREKGIEVENNIIRIEMILQGARLRKEYGKDVQLFDILNNLNKILYLFRYKYMYDVKKHYYKFLKEIKQCMFEELTQGEMPRNICVKYKDVIIDRRQIEMALKRYYEFKGIQDQSKAISKVLSNKIFVDEGVITELNYIFRET